VPYDAKIRPSEIVPLGEQARSLSVESGATRLLSLPWRRPPSVGSFTDEEHPAMPSAKAPHTMLLYPLSTRPRFTFIGHNLDRDPARSPRVAPFRFRIFLSRRG